MGGVLLGKVGEATSVFNAQSNSPYCGVKMGQNTKLILFSNTYTKMARHTLNNVQGAHDKTQNKHKI